MFRWPWISI